jgi:SAM-dependent methyltransferase
VSSHELTSLLDKPARRLDSGALDALEPASNGLPERFGPDRLERIEAMGQRHFWFAGRRARVERLLQDFLRTPRTIHDIGCGTGLTLRTFDRKHRLAGTDRLLEGVERAAERNPDALLVRADVADLPFRDGAFDLVLLLDVIEHVDDGAALAEARRVLRRAGLAAITVPALPWLWSGRDRAAGHLRRYTRASLAGAIEGAGLEVRSLGYYQFLLFPLVAGARLVRRGSDSPAELEETPPGALNTILSRVNSFEATLAAKVPVPFGSSLVALCSRP